MGIRASSTCEVILQDVFVSDHEISYRPISRSVLCPTPAFHLNKVSETRRLDESGKGYRIAMDLLNEGRIGKCFVCPKIFMPR